MLNESQNQNGGVVINPEFKSAASKLNKCAQRELNVQISIDKLTHDNDYRTTVINELGELGSDGLDEHIQAIKLIPVYLKAAPETALSVGFGNGSGEVNGKVNGNGNGIGKIKNKLFYPGKKSRSYALLAASAFIFLSICLVLAWKSFFPVSLSTQPVVSQNSTNSSMRNPGITDTAQRSERVYARQNVIAERVTPKQNFMYKEARERQVVSAAAVVQQREVTLPSGDRKVNLRLHGSNTVGEHLAPALLEAYLKSSGIKKMLWVQGEHKFERELQYIKDNQVYAIELKAHGSSTGFRDLLEGTADMGMASRPIKEEEVQALQPLYGNLGLAGQEYIISLDGVAVIVNPGNPVNTLTTETLAKVFSGEINNWKALGGPDLAITLLAHVEGSGTGDTFKHLILKPFDKQLNSRAERLESSSEISALVAEKIGAIGFIGLPYIHNSKAVSIAASDGVTPIYPTSFTIKTEDYPLSRRLFMYAPSVGNDMVRQFAKFAVSQTGQDIVEQVGLISQNIKLETVHKVENAPEVYNKYTETAKRLSVNFRFKIGSNELDNKSKADVSRLFEYISNNQGLRMVLMGFSDVVGDAKHNMKLSVLRANLLERELTSRGLNVTAVEAFGAQLPVASNRNALGRSKNRRVEVWVF